MLNVQVQYLNYLETAKHNRAMEDIGFQTVSETVRHDYVVENQGQQTINESIRTHKANEAIAGMQAQASLKQAETSRMLANAQIPLIAAQTDTEKQKALTERERTYLTSMQGELAKYQSANEEIMSNYNQFLYGMDNEQLGMAYGVSKVANEIVPF